MKCFAILVFLLVGPLGLAQVTVQNPQHLPLSELEVETLHNIVCRVVAEEFHVRPNRFGGTVILVLGADQEHTVADETKGTFTIYLKRWDEATFASSDLQLAVQRLVGRDRWQRMGEEALRRARQTIPIPANTLK